MISEVKVLFPEVDGLRPLAKLKVDPQFINAYHPAGFSKASMAFVRYRSAFLAEGIIQRESVLKLTLNN